MATWRRPMSLSRGRAPRKTSRFREHDHLAPIDDVSQSAAGRPTRKKGTEPRSLQAAQGTELQERPPAVSVNLSLHDAIVKDEFVPCPCRDKTHERLEPHAGVFAGVGLHIGPACERLKPNRHRANGAGDADNGAGVARRHCRPLASISDTTSNAGRPVQGYGARLSTTVLTGLTDVAGRWRRCGGLHAACR